MVVRLLVEAEDIVLANSIRQPLRRYGHVKTLTEKLMEDALALLDAPTPGEVSLTQSHALIRAGNDYADLFTLGAQQSAMCPPNRNCMFSAGLNLYFLSSPCSSKDSF